MSILQYKLAYYPRQLFKYLLFIIYPFCIKLWKMPIVKSIDATLDKVLIDNCSVCRYGDGEVLYIIHKTSIAFQRYDTELRNKLINILETSNQRIIVCLPNGYYSLENLSKKSTLTWSSIVVWTYPFLKKYLILNKTYYNTNMTRPYMDYKDKTNSSGYFLKLMKIWEGRKVLLVEGEKSRLGVKNDLFNNARSIERILAPALNAFTKYKELIEEVEKHSKSKLILIALGPTATVMAYDLTILGFQAIDIGHVDIEYEWYLRRSKDKIKIPGKYTNEAIGGKKVEDLHDKLYENQIIARIL
jgi:glycosyltransferase family protein